MSIELYRIIVLKYLSVCGKEGFLWQRDAGALSGQWLAKVVLLRCHSSKNPDGILNNELNYLIFILHLCSPIGGGAPRDSVSSGLFMLDLLKVLLNLQRETRICPTAIHWMKSGDVGSLSDFQIMDFPVSLD